jgi:hypothetical protein
MHSYIKQYTDSGGGYVIIQNRDDGTHRNVADNYGGYVLFKATNTVPEIPYVAPAAPGIQPPPLEERVAALGEALLSLIDPNS